MVIFLGLSGGILAVAGLLIFAGELALRTTGPVFAGFVWVASAVLISAACIVQAIQDLQRNMSGVPAVKDDRHSEVIG